MPKIIIEIEEFIASCSTFAAATSFLCSMKSLETEVGKRVILDLNVSLSIKPISVKVEPFSPINGDV